MNRKQVIHTVISQASILAADNEGNRFQVNGGSAVETTGDKSKYQHYSLTEVVFDRDASLHSLYGISLTVILMRKREESG